LFCRTHIFALIISLLITPLQLRAEPIAPETTEHLIEAIKNIPPQVQQLSAGTLRLIREMNGPQTLVGGAALGGAAVGTGPIVLGTLAVIGVGAVGYAVYQYVEDQQEKRRKWKALDPKEVLEALTDCQSGTRVCMFGPQSSGQFIPYIPKSAPFGTAVKSNPPKIQKGFIKKGALTTDDLIKRSLQNQREARARPNHPEGLGVTTQNVDRPQKGPKEGSSDVTAATFLKKWERELLRGKVRPEEMFGFVASKGKRRTLQKLVADHDRLIANQTQEKLKGADPEAMKKISESLQQLNQKMATAIGLASDLDMDPLVWDLRRFGAEWYLFSQVQNIEKEKNEKPRKEMLENVRSFLPHLLNLLGIAYETKALRLLKEGELETGFRILPVSGVSPLNETAIQLEQKHGGILVYAVSSIADMDYGWIFHWRKEEQGTALHPNGLLLWDAPVDPTVEHEAIHLMQREKLLRGKFNLFHGEAEIFAEEERDNSLPGSLQRVLKEYSEITVFEELLTFAEDAADCGKLIAFYEERLANLRRDRKSYAERMQLTLQLNILKRVLRDNAMYGEAVANTILHTTQDLNQTSILDYASVRYERVGARQRVPYINIARPKGSKRALLVLRFPIPDNGVKEVLTNYGRLQRRFTNSLNRMLSESEKMATSRQELLRMRRAAALREKFELNLKAGVSKLRDLARKFRLEFHKILELCSQKQYPEATKTATELQKLAKEHADVPIYKE